MRHRGASASSCISPIQQTHSAPAHSATVLGKRTRNAAAPNCFVCMANRRKGPFRPEPCVFHTASPPGTGGMVLKVPLALAMHKSQEGSSRGQDAPAKLCADCPSVRVLCCAMTVKFRCNVAACSPLWTPAETASQ